MSKKRSIVWNYFVEDANQLICQVLVNKKKCGAHLKKNGNTSTMLNHLKSFHPHLELENETNKEKNSETPLKCFLSNQQVYNETSTKYKELTDGVVDFITHCSEAVSLVDNPWFVKMLAKFDNRYVLPSRRKFTDIIKFYIPLRL